jgi:serine/threonine-protein kinase
MLGLLGRGGMGEVYRADDLKLGQPVALKFLPLDVERDAARLEQFLTEVRMSLRVTHPNVCRVFDIGQLEDVGAGSGHHRHFLSMEYVDGEDLASLLRRIGRLPEDKAIEIARQLCSGLAAAHDEGVLHRDLKPANIMIDGRGRAKIADFGLAGATAGISGRDARSGTPQYMAPEQVSGGELTERTDLYALGLVLYELFTGKRAYDIKNLDDLQRLTTSAPTRPSSHISGLNPLVERAILRCLEPDPAKRPASASALAAALPGGDPLAMAVAAGDTPSPEMVAAAGSDAGLRPAVAWPLLAVALVGAIAVALMGQHLAVYRVGAPLKAPAVLIERAQEIMRSAGYDSAAQDSGWGLAPNLDYLGHVETGKPVGLGDRLETRGVSFWYRESPVLFERLIFLKPDLTPTMWPNDPPMNYSGEVRVMLDREGRLVDLTAVPSQKRTADALRKDVDWSGLFRAAGLDQSDWMPAEPEWTPYFNSDQRIAWIPRDSTMTSPNRVEAASFEGRPVSFSLVFPWTMPFRIIATRRTPQQRGADLFVVLILTAVMIGSAVVARRNLRLDRADRRGATRLAGFVAALWMFVWIVDEHHVASIWELYLAIMAAGSALFVAVMLAAFYLALEPYVRRTWPGIIMSWSRVVAGTIRDPLVARDVLIGCATSAVLSSLDSARAFAIQAVSGILPREMTGSRPFLGSPHALSQLASMLVVAIFMTLLFLFILFALRKLLRREWLAIVAGSLILTLPNALSTPAPLVSAPFDFVVLLLVFTLIARAGLVAAIASAFVGYVLSDFPLAYPANTWYSTIGFVGVTVVAVLAIAAFRIATQAHANITPVQERT